MKKFLFLALAAMLALTSCTQDETLDVAQNGSIGFDVSSDKATRSIYDPSITTNNIQDFAVYGWMNAYTGKVFDDELVSRNGGAWSYSNTQYWIADNNYYFAALAPSVSRNWELTQVNNQAAAELGIGSVKFTNAEGKQDLLYWAQGPIKGQLPGQNSPVAVKFNHILSKVKFTFVNEFDNSLVNLKVSNIKINGLEKVANIDLATATWWTNKNAWALDATEKVDFNFGAASVSGETTADYIGQYQKMESYNELLLFPHESRNYNVTFTVELYMNDVLADTYNHNIEVPAEFLMGKAYNLKAIINSGNIVDPEDPGHQGEANPEPITFIVEVIDWDQAGEVEMPTLTPAEDKLMQDIAAAQQTGAKVTLSSDVALTNSLVIDKNVTIDLNGKNLTGGLFTESNGAMTAGQTDSYVFWVKDGATLTIEGEGTIVSQAAKYSMAVWAQGGKVVINGGNFYNNGEGSDLIYASAGGEVVIKGGKFVACEKQAGVSGTQEKRSALNIKGDGTNSSITVYGGTFFHFNPANNKSEGDNTNYVAPGYKSVYDNATGYYTVVPE